VTKNVLATKWPKEQFGEKCFGSLKLGQAAKKELFSIFSFIFIFIIIIIIIVICFSPSSSFSQSGRKRGSDSSMQMVQWDGVWEER
jgi:hypothetical protein